MGEYSMTTQFLNISKKLALVALIVPCMAQAWDWPWTKKPEIKKPEINSQELYVFNKGRLDSIRLSQNLIRRNYLRIRGDVKPTFNDFGQHAEDFFKKCAKVPEVDKENASVAETTKEGMDDCEKLEKELIEKQTKVIQQLAKESKKLRKNWAEENTDYVQTQKDLAEYKDEQLKQGIDPDKIIEEKRQAVIRAELERQEQIRLAQEEELERQRFFWNRKNFRNSAESMWKYTQEKPEIVGSTLVAAPATGWSVYKVIKYMRPFLKRRI
jgi:hypothetical protein